jgi:hypothetical protein
MGLSSLDIEKHLIEHLILNNQIKQLIGLSNYVPYTGATSDVDLGSKNLTTAAGITITNTTYLTGGFVSKLLTSTTFGANNTTDIWGLGNGIRYYYGSYGIKFTSGALINQIFGIISVDRSFHIPGGTYDTYTTYSSITGIAVNDTFEIVKFSKLNASVMDIGYRDEGVIKTNVLLADKLVFTNDTYTYIDVTSIKSIYKQYPTASNGGGIALSQFPNPGSAGYTFYGFNNLVDFSNNNPATLSTNIGSIYGIYNKLDMGKTGGMVLSNYYGGYFTLSESLADGTYPTITNSYGLYVVNSYLSGGETVKNCTNAYGLYINSVVGNSTNWGIYDNSGTSWFQKDNAKHIFGTGGDSSIYYNGTNFLIDPREVGTGYVGLLGNVVIGDGTAGEDFTLTFDGETNDGILTWMEDEDYFKFSDDIMMLGGENIVLDTTTGTKIGTSTTQKLGFWNATPVVQQATNAYTSDAESSAYTGIDNLQAGTVYATVADLNTLRVAYDNLRASYDDLRTKLITTGIVA